MFPFGAGEPSNPSRLEPIVVILQEIGNFLTEGSQQDVELEGA